MSAFTRERTDGDWYRGLQIPETVIRNIDEKTKKAVSGTGGTWTPSSALIIGGEGLELQCALQLTLATAAPAVGKYFIFGDDDYFQNVTPTTRDLDTAAISVLGTGMWDRNVWSKTLITTASAPKLMTRMPGAFVRIPVRIPDGSYLNQVDVAFQVSTLPPTGVPEILPSARLVRISADGTIEQVPGLTNTVAEPDGQVSPTLPASAAAWYAAGAVQTLTLTFTSTEKTDTSLYDYALEWREEDGINAFGKINGAQYFQGNFLLHVKVNVSQPDGRPY